MNSLRKEGNCHDELTHRDLNQRLESEIESKIRSELTLKLYDSVKTSFRLRYIFDLICHELCCARLDNA